MATPTAGPPSPTHSLNDLRRRANPKVPKRRLTMRERRWKLLQTVVPWVLTFIFGITSVGMFMTFRQPPAHNMTPEDNVKRLNDRLSAQRGAALKAPNDPEMPYQVAKTDLELAQASAGKPEEAKKYRDDAVASLHATLKIDPSYPPALKDLAHMDIEQGTTEGATDKDKADREAAIKEAITLLTDGIKAEGVAIDKLNKNRGKDDPEVFPDATLRALLFHAYLLEGGHDKEARAAAVEGIHLNPNEFANYLRQMTLMAALRQHRDMAMQACDMALDAAKQVNDPTAVDDVQQVKKMVDSIQTQQSIPPNIKEAIEKARKSKIGASASPAAGGASSSSPQAGGTTVTLPVPGAAASATTEAAPAATAASPAGAASPATNAASPAATASSPAAPTAP